MTMEEIWKDIAGYEGRYQVSNLGRVRSLDRYQQRTDYRYGKQYERFKKGLMLTQHQSNRGYMRVPIYDKDGQRKMALVHRLVAQAFIPNTDNLPEVNHKNEDKTDNRVDNLEWCSPQYNTNYGTGHERITEPKRMKVAMVDEQGNIIRKFESIKEASEQTGEARLTITRQCKRESTLGHVLKYYRWKFI